jgi:solute carrier family 25 protein 34/35
MASEKTRYLKPGASVLAGATAACAAVLVSNVPETIKTRIQLDGEGVLSGAKRQYTGIWNAFTTIAKNEGIAGLQSGLRAALCYQAVMNGCRLGLYEPIQRLLHAFGGLEQQSMLMKVIAGASSGAIGATLGSPLYLVKNRLQAESKFFKAKETHSYTGMTDGLRKLYRSEGVRGLFRGVDGAVPRVMVGSATQLTSFDYFRGWCNKLGVPAGSPQAVVAALCSSVVTVTCMNPFDVVSTRLYQSGGNATKYTSPIDCAMQTWRNEGPRAFMKGWTAQNIRLGPHTVITFFVLEHLKPAMLSLDFLIVESGV